MLLETIQVKDRELLRLPYHEARIARSLNSIYNSNRAIDFSVIKEEARKLDAGRYKLRIEYGENFLKYTIDPYRIPTIKSLQLVHCCNLKYGFKFSDRSNLDRLHALRGAADDVLIINSGMVTDTWFCNVALLREGNWETPYLPLLHGTQRAALLGKEVIREAMITENDLSRYEKISLFNAMIEFGEIELDVGTIVISKVKLSQ